MSDLNSNSTDQFWGDVPTNPAPTSIQAHESASLSIEDEDGSLYARKAPWYKRWWGILLIAIGGLMSVLFAAMMFIPAPGGNKSPPPIAAAAPAPLPQTLPAEPAGFSSTNTPPPSSVAEPNPPAPDMGTAKLPDTAQSVASTPPTPTKTEAPASDRLYSGNSADKIKNPVVQSAPAPSRASVNKVSKKTQSQGGVEQSLKAAKVAVTPVAEFAEAGQSTEELIQLLGVVVQRGTPKAIIRMGSVTQRITVGDTVAGVGTVDRIEIVSGKPVISVSGIEYKGQ